MLTFITVHGTGDGPRDEIGAEPQWWRPESPFCAELLAAAPAGSRVEPFTWSGANDEVKRRAAADLLLKRLRAAEANGERVHLIGHSHGGSVIATTLRYATAERRRLPSLVAITSIGTPFLQLTNKVLPWERYGPIGQAALTFGAIAVLMIGFQLVMMLLSLFSGGFQADIFAAIILLGGFTVVGLCALILMRLGRQRRGLHGKVKQRRFSEAFGARWLAIASAGDEAIGGLTRLTALRARVFGPGILNGAAGLVAQVAYLSFIFVWWVMLLFGANGANADGTPYSAWSFFSEPNSVMHNALGPILQPFVWLHAHWVEAVRHLFFDAVLTGGDYAYPDWLGHIFTALFALVLVGGYFAGLIAIISAVQWLTQRTIGAWLAQAMNASVRGAVLNAGYGASAVRENPSATAATLFGDIEMLPPPVDEQVLRFAEEHLLQAYRGVHRAVFDFGQADVENLSLAEAALKHVTWSELVHTGYFRVAECRAHLIRRIVERC